MVSELKTFGLSEYEAKTYLAMSMYGPLTASKISKKSTVPQSKIYNILKDLVEKSLAQVWSGKPQRFKATELNMGLNNLIAKQKNQIKNLEEKKKQLTMKVKKYNDEEKDQIWSASGSELFVSKMCSLLDKTKTEAGFIMPGFSRFSNLDKSISKAVKRGVSVKMVGINEKEISRLRSKWYENKGVKVKTGELQKYPVIGLFDKKNACIKIDDSDFMWSNNPAVVDMIKAYFDKAWK